MEESSVAPIPPRTYHDNRHDVGLSSALTRACFLFGRQAGHGTAGLAGAGQSAPPPGDATYRSPSASIGFLLMTQLQFLALLSLVPSIDESTSLLSSFVQNLRFVRRSFRRVILVRILPRMASGVGNWASVSSGDSTQTWSNVP